MEEYPESYCVYCGQKHEFHEDASCGCGCGDNPMGCGWCKAQGGPPIRFDYHTGRRIEPSYAYDPDDPYAYYDEY